MLAQPEVARFIQTERGRADEAVTEAVRKAGVKPETFKQKLGERPDSGYIGALRTLFDLKGMQLWLPIALLALAAIALTALLSALGVDAAALLGIVVPLIVGLVGLLGQ